MKKPILIALLAAVFTQGKAQNVVSINASGFTDVENSTIANVNLYQSDEYRVELMAPKNFADDMKIFVENGTLKVEKKGVLTSWFTDDDKVTLNVWAPRFNVLSVTGSGDMVTRTPITTQELAVRVSGSGDVEVGSLEANTLSVLLNGSGDVKVGGAKTLDRGEYSVNGSGDIEVSRIPCKRVSANVTGSGDIDVWATEELTARIVGSGDIEYRGDPKIEAKVVGSGRIKRDS